MPAKTKSQLLDITNKEFTKLEALITPITADVAMAKREDDTSIKDVVAHRAHWIELFLGWYADGLAGKTVHFPAPGYKWNELKRYNADLRQRQGHLDWPQASALLADRSGDLLAFIDGCTDDDLYGGPMKGANNAWTTGRWAEAAGPSHFRSASKYIRSVLKTIA